MAQVIAPIAQACAIPFRIVEGRLEFCLITSIRNGKWGFPKGIIDPGETAEQTALKEAHEEAGLSGHIVGAPVCAYHYKKWGTTLRVTVFLMQVSEAAPRWEEATVRKRRFCEAAAVSVLLGDSPQQGPFAEALSRLHPGG